MHINTLTKDKLGSVTIEKLTGAYLVYEQEQEDTNKPLYKVSISHPDTVGFYTILHKDDAVEYFNNHAIKPIN